MAKKVELSKLKIDESIYPRSAVSEFNVGRLAAAFKTGTKLPPLIVEARTLRIIDGRHRYEMFKREGVTTVTVEEKVYASEADLFADAVRYNVGHGEPLDQYSVRSAIIRLEEYGYTREKISEVVRLPSDQIEKITRGFATDADTGKPIALKGGLSHMRGQSLSSEQIALNKHYSGGKAVFHLRQLCELIETDMWPNNSQSFISEMDRLVSLWDGLKKKTAAA